MVVVFHLQAVEGDHLPRLGEGVHALVERLDHLAVVQRLVAHEHLGQHFFVRTGDGRCRRHPGLRVRQLLLEPAPQLVGVEVGVDGHALRPERLPRELVGADRDVDGRVVHEHVELVDRAADAGQAIRIAGRLRPQGHVVQLGADGQRARGRIEGKVIERATEPLEQIGRLPVDCADGLRQGDVAGPFRMVAVVLLPVAERVVGLPEVESFGSRLGEIQRLGLGGHRRRSRVGGARGGSRIRERAAGRGRRPGVGGGSGCAVGFGEGDVALGREW